MAATSSTPRAGPLRLSPILKSLSFSDLVANKVIHCVPAHFSVVPKKYPPWVYQSKSFPLFGLWMDYVVRAGFRIFLTSQVSRMPTVSLEVTDSTLYHTYTTSTSWGEVIFASYRLVCQQFGQPTSLYSNEQITKYIPTITKTVKDLIVQWQSFAPVLTTGEICSEVEYCYDDLAGHPDMVVQQADKTAVILDIKCSANFATYQEHSWMQILGYAALAKASGMNVKYVGLVMPLQRKINLVDLTNWDSSMYLGILLDKANTLQQVQQLPAIEQILMSLYELVASPNRHTITDDNRLMIGHHIHKPKLLAKGFKDYVLERPGCATQLFLTARAGKCSKATFNQLNEARAVVLQHQLPLYVHSPYCINMCANQYDQNTGRFWQQDILNLDLWMTQALGGRGVVVHTGARDYRSEEEALNIMEVMVRAALPYATSSCPLMLETPVGEGTEVCAEISSFGTFFLRFNEEERSKLAICVDTCHVFASGADPIAYMDHWETYCKIKIGLVHFNDSQGPFGSHRDLHAPAGSGYIGGQKMTAVAQWCQLRNIHMVVE